MVWRIMARLAWHGVAWSGWASPGGDMLGRALRGSAGEARPGELGLVGLGEQWLDGARLGLALLAMARRVPVGRGMAAQGSAWRGCPGQATRVLAGLGRAGHGTHALANQAPREYRRGSWGA